jgi:hypothetical protein
LFIPYPDLNGVYGEGNYGKMRFNDKQPFTLPATLGCAKFIPDDLVAR